MFYCELCEISENNFFTEDLWTTASEFVSEMLIFRSSRSQMFFKISVLITSQYWSLFRIIKLQTFFYETPTVAASEFLWQQIHFCSLNMVFIADSRTGFCSLFWTPLKTRVKPQR